MSSYSAMVWSFRMGLALVAVLPTAAMADYFTDFSTDVSGNFSYGEVGQANGDDVGPDTAHRHVDFTSQPGVLRLSARYNSEATQTLVVTGNTKSQTAGDLAGVYEDTFARMTFSYIGAPDTSRAGMGIRIEKAGEGVNNYPLYLAMLSGNTMSIVKWTGYNASSVLDTYTFSGEEELVGGATQYRLDFSAVGNPQVNVTATLYADGIALHTLDATDSVDSIAAGNIGLIGGSSVTNSTFYGIDIDSFGVGSTGFPIPEPASLALLGLGAAMAAGRRRRG